MRKKRKVFYEVTTYDSVMWCYKYKRWLHMSDPLYGTEPHKGYSSHKRCYTKNSALRVCRALAQLTKEDIKVLRFSYCKGKRRIDDFSFVRS